MRSRIALAFWAFGLCLILTQAGRAQAPAPEAAPAAESAAPGGLPPGLSQADASRVLALLKNPSALADFEAKLEALSKASALAPSTSEPAATKPETPATSGPEPAAPAAKPAAAPPPPAAKPLPLKPNSLGARLLVSASGLLGRLSVQALAALAAVRSIPSLFRWTETMATDPLARQTLLDTIWRLAAVLACGLAAEWAVRLLIARVAARFHDAAPTAREDQPADETEVEPDPVADAEAGETERRRLRPTAWTLLRRVPLVLGRLVLDLMPIAAFLLVAYLATGTNLGGTQQTRLILLAIIEAYAVVGGVMAAARMIFSPARPRLRLVHVTDAGAAYAMLWLWWITSVAVAGYAAGSVGLLLGLSQEAHDGLLKAVGLALHVMAAVVVLQKRRAVARWIRPRRPDASGVAAALRIRIAAVWHWIAIFYLAATWAVWALEVQDGYSKLLYLFLVTTVVMISARIVLVVLLGTVDRIMRPRPGDSAGPAGLRDRLRLYYPLARGAVRGVVWIAAALVLAQAWGLGALDWIMSASLGRGVLSACVTIGVTILVAILVWELVNLRFERHLERLTREGQNARAVRLQTLLPMIRTTLLVTIGIVAGLTVLNQVGVNIGPLLAGAGIVGVAIGFGSQKLVQDLITGIFLLLENAMQVGDAVTVSGLSGTVEHLSVRTIKLRAGDGSVHIIPFSAVTTVTNTNRGLGNAPVTVTVAFDEDTDRVGEELKAIVSEMQDDPEYGSKILAPLELWGVDKVDGSSATIAGQIRCTDSGRYPVQREFNRRLKKRCQELGIAIYNPSVSYMVERPSPPPPEPPPGAAVQPDSEAGPAALPRAAE